MVTWSSIRWDVIIGGLGLFLFGIKFMGDGLKSYAGDNLRDIIDKYTTKPIYGVLIGALITIFIQSSSATTAIAISLIRVGLMRLDQAVGVIMGANIGTTVTAFLIGLNIDAYSLWFVFAGAMVFLFAQRHKTRSLAEIIFGFGALFYGLSLMGNELSIIKDIPSFQTFAAEMTQAPILALLAGMAMTGVIQSSSATIGIIQKIYGAGGVSLTAALPFIFGANIGTTVTGILASLGGSLAARRAAGIHTLFNVIGSIISFILLKPFVDYVVWVSAFFNPSPEMQLAIAHITFNVVATILFFPFIKNLVKMIKVIIPGKEEERKAVVLDELDTKLIASFPSSALEVSKRNIIKMFECAIECVKDARNFYQTKSGKAKQEALQMEDIINNLDGKITKYITLIGRENLSDSDLVTYNINFQVIKNLERIGDLATNLVEFFDLVYESRESFSELAINELDEMFNLVEKMLKNSLEIFINNDLELGHEIMEQEDFLDELEIRARQLHFERMRKGDCISAVASSVYVDILGTLERIGDHTANISKTTLNYNDINHLPAGQH